MPEVHIPKFAHVPIFILIGPTDFPGSWGLAYVRT